MPELTVGLPANKTSYFDPLTGAYITLAKPVQTITYTDHTQLKNITHAVLASVPSLVLYEGKIPQESIDAFEAKYMKPFYTDMTKKYRDLNGDIVSGTKVPNRAFDRPEIVNAKSVDNSVEGASAGEGEEVTFEAASVEENHSEPTLVEQQETVQEEVLEEEKPKRGARSTKKAAE